MQWEIKINVSIFSKYEYHYRAKIYLITQLSLVFLFNRSLSLVLAFWSTVNTVFLTDEYGERFCITSAAHIIISGL